MNAFVKRSRSPRIYNEDPAVRTLREGWSSLPKQKLVSMLRRLNRRGASVREIARALGVNESTLRWHLSSQRRQSERTRRSPTRDRHDKTGTTPALQPVIASAQQETSNLSSGSRSGMAVQAPSAAGRTSGRQANREQEMTQLLTIVHEFDAWVRKNQLSPAWVFQLALMDFQAGTLRPAPSRRPAPDCENEREFVPWLLNKLYAVTTDSQLILQVLTRMASR